MTMYGNADLDAVRATLRREVADHVKGGWAVESQTPDQVVLVKGTPIRHGRWILGTLLTAGILLLFYVPRILMGGVKRRVLTATPSGVHRN